jgi:hypothetical protein
MEGDVVEYPLPEEVRQGGLYGNSSCGLGAVHELVSDNSSSTVMCHIEPLVMVFPHHLHTTPELGSNFMKKDAGEFRVGVGGFLQA